MKLPETSSRNLAILFTVPVVGMISGAIAPVNRVNQYAILRVRPEPWIFGVAWLILYFLVSFAWIYALSSETRLTDWYLGEDYEITIYVLYGLLVLSLFLWPFIYNKSTRWSLYSIVISIMLTIMSMVVSPTGSRLALTPLLVWLFFATMMNYTVANGRN
jgi:tryptophan-rich sensory protein